ncbi:phosphomannomutase [Methanothermobacter thermautotrophicus str. Delta H]|uniref:Probable phosphoglucosamine mutase n=1 Tax=Methanothermobacter thermautotrophicus (strain ATCC 29096 / DSM 1053 / JCM 10044 / NBRC 100330 / Delta H) TaxID=187420 RepID=GLMM_METTH|nr:phosphoglucosamine mutase [Methanothermobacter thermautotrophicus]O27627.1 RecName: Full=Probable phosphoglucosamine mutase [Methanothermobacter thermautotrophicus str. Delta H]AAB86063.1 phosphomannomutase [Methanothermobacter thermautotrophicus str. Delta H]
MKEKKPRLFGTSGIRGRFGEKVTLELTAEHRKALATHLGGDGEVVVGYDTRTSSQLLENALIAGIVECGCDVTRLGMVPTPLVGYAASRLGAAAGVMITASHNPAPYNGIKLWNPDGMAYRPSQERVIESIIHSRDFKRKAWDELGSITTVDMRDDYVRAVLETVEIKKPLKVVIDSGCGAASHLSPLIFRKAGCRVITLNSQPDGFFPGRDPEPVPENLSELMETVRSTGADLGIAHDGDADRMVAIDDQGRFASFDKLLALMAREIGGKIITTVDASLCVDECLGDRGEVIRTRVGDVHVANTIAEEGARFGGEPSGTWLHPDFCMCPDGILSALRVAELVSARGPLSELLEEVPSYPNIRDKVPCPDEKKDIIMERVAAELSDQFSETSDINTIDGVRISLDDGSWVLVRPSGTEPYIRITLEGKTEEKARYIHERTRGYLENVIG